MTADGHDFILNPRGDPGIYVDEAMAHAFDSISRKLFAKHSELTEAMLLALALQHEDLDGARIVTEYGPNVVKTYVQLKSRAMLCFAHGGSEACEEENKKNGLICPKCASKEGGQ